MSLAMASWDPPTVPAPAAAPVVCIIGPTASGKTATALALARALDGEIVSCDSVAVYRELDIGAAKPTLAERAEVPHHLIDVVPPSERFSAARFAESADRAAAEIHGRGRAVIACGGSGLYLRAWLCGLCPTPPPDPARRARHQATPLGELRDALTRVDPEAAARIGPQDRVRISRALEVYEQTGVAFSRLQREHKAAPRYRALLFGLSPPRIELWARIDARVDRMIADGWLIEVRALRERYGADAPGLHSLGYTELAQHLCGTLTLEEAIARAKRATHRFARRQLAWFRKQPGVLWSAAAPGDLAAQAAQFLQAAARGSWHGDRDG
jgi:tRNA dimethylallyltransferase